MEPSPLFFKSETEIEYLGPVWMLISVTSVCPFSRVFPLILRNAYILKFPFFPVQSSLAGKSERPSLHLLCVLGFSFSRRSSGSNSKYQLLYQLYSIEPLPASWIRSRVIIRFPHPFEIQCIPPPTYPTGMVPSIFNSKVLFVRTAKYGDFERTIYRLKVGNNSFCVVNIVKRPLMYSAFEGCFCVVMTSFCSLIQFGYLLTSASPQRQAEVTCKKSWSNNKNVGR